MKQLIEVDRVSFGYTKPDGSRVPVLGDLSMTIAENEIYCLLGVSGCGKTTLLGLIAGFCFPDAGAVKLDGTEILGPGVDRGVVFQGDDSLFDWLSAVDNVAFGLRMRHVPRPERREEARRFLRLVGLSTADELKRPAEMSGGMKQRLQVARVLANHPRILLLDEPFAAVDALTRARLQEELLSIWTKTRTTMLFVTHDIAEAILLADRIGVMGFASGAIEREFTNSLPRPRSHSHSQFGQLYEQIRDVLRG